MKFHLLNAYDGFSCELWHISNLAHFYGIDSHSDHVLAFYHSQICRMTADNS